MTQRKNSIAMASLNALRILKETTTPKQSLTRLVAVIAFAVAATDVSAAEIEIPKSLDDRLTIELFAAEPDVMTVTGLTVDTKGRVLVVESHTHFRPEQYDGPETDRIRMLEDTNGDGRADRVTTFFSGTTHTMNVAAHPNGWIYVATRNSVFRVRDTDDDGKADKRQNLVHLQTDSDYPHNGLSGFAFDFAGHVYFGLGENMGQNATLVSSGNIYFAIGQNLGKDATVVDAGGTRIPVNRGAGGVFRCQTDGRELQQMATGFWNPFHLCFDAYGRMFLGDNDPGNRPPCRFLSIVDGGDYGYRRRTLEPFISVNGETPGRLPMTSSTGESPTGTVVYESDHLPDDYRGDVLVASWGEHRIDRYHLTRDGASFKATSQAVIAGGEKFRPAGIAVAPDGSLFVGDWADRSYDLHGKGRVWHIRATDQTKSKRRASSNKDRLSSADRSIRESAARGLLREGETGVAELRERVVQDDNPRVRAVALDALISIDAVTDDLARAILQDGNEVIREQATRELPKKQIDLAQVARSDKSLAVQAAALRRIEDPAHEAILLARLDTRDPFMQQAARRGLAQSLSAARLAELTSDKRAHVRLAALLLLRDDKPGQGTSHRDLLTADRDRVIGNALRDANAHVRFVAIEWVGRDMLEQFRELLIEGLARGATTPQLFEAYLAALAQLDGVMQHWTKGTVGDWWVGKANSHRYAVELLDDPSTSPDALRQVLLFLPASHPALTIERLSQLIDSDHRPIRIEAVRALRDRSSEKKTTRDRVRTILSALAVDPSRSPNLRAEAIVGLNPVDAADRTLLLKLTHDSEPVIKHESLRTLRGVDFNTKEADALAAIGGTDAAAGELVGKLLNSQPTTDRPDAERLEDWLELLEGPAADAHAGKRIFFHPKGPGCASCHRIDGRGHAVGPSLLRNADGRLALSRRSLIEAILQPSKNIDPGYLPLMILTVDGRVTSGIFYKHGNGIRRIIDSKGEILSFKDSDIEEMVPQRTSIMPKGLVDTMTLQEFRDLIAYLTEPTTSDATAAPE